MPGNNSQLVRRVIQQSQRSESWQEIDNQTSSNFSFRWAPVSKQVNFDRLGFNFPQMTNHFECHNEISRKHELFRNLKQICEDMNENVFEITPLTFFIKINAEKPLQSMKQQLQQFKNVYFLLDEFKNHFETLEEKGLDTNNSQIKSFTSKKKDSQTSSSNFSKDYLTTQKLFNGNKSDLIMPQCHFRGRNVWILKPTSMNRGQGIHVVNSFKKLKKLIRDYCKGREVENPQLQQLSASHNNFKEGQIQNQDLIKPQVFENNPIAQQSLKDKTRVIKNSSFIIQKYIEDPFLINQRKFDIRVWVLINQDSDIFFFKEGYLRTSSSEYTTDKKSLDNDFVHLTNNAVQKNAPNYGDFEDGNQLSFGYFKQYLKDQNCAVDFETQILAKMKYYAALSIESVRRKLNPNKRKQCFEIFGYDYIIDKDFNVWLIEANTNPCIEQSSSILKVLIPRMLDDAFKLTIDKIFPETSGDSKTNDSKLQVKQQLSEIKDKYKIISKVSTNKSLDLNEKTYNQNGKFLQPNISPTKQSTAVNQSKIKDSGIQNNNASNLNGNFHVPGYLDIENMWQVLQQQLFTFNTGRKYNKKSNRIYFPSKSM